MTEKLNVSVFCPRRLNHQQKKEEERGYVHSSVFAQGKGSCSSRPTLACLSAVAERKESQGIDETITHGHQVNATYEE